MATTLVRPGAPDVAPVTPVRPRRASWPLVALLVGAPVLRMVSILIHPLDTEDALETLALVDREEARWALAHLLEPAANLLLAAAAFVLLRLVTGAGRRKAVVGASMFAAGSSGLALLVHAHGEAYRNMAHSSVDQSQMVALYERFHEGVPLAAPLIPFFVLGAALLGVGLYESRRVPLWAVVGFVVATVLPNAIPQEDSLTLAAIVGSAPMIAAMVAFAAALRRQEAEIDLTVR